MATQQSSAQSEKRLLIVEDDKAFRNRLTLSMERKGFTVFAAEGVEEGGVLAADTMPQYAILDMRLEDGNGLDLVPTLRQLRPDMRIVILTGYGNIASAVAAVKAGVVDYLAKPADPDEIAKTLLTLEGTVPPPPEVF